MVKVGNHCRVDCTSTLYTIIIVLAPFTVNGCHKDVTPLCCCNPVQQTQGHSCGIWWLGALANFILVSHPVNRYKRCFVCCCLYAGSGHIPTETPPSTQSLLGHREQISGWSYTLMSTSHCWRCWNTLYIYKVNLLWVWTGLGVSIPSTNRDSYSCTKHQAHHS